MSQQELNPYATKQSLAQSQNYVPYPDPNQMHGYQADLQEDSQSLPDESSDELHQYKNREAFFQNIVKDKYLSQSLEGIDFASITEDEFAILLIWTAPLRTSNTRLIALTLTLNFRNHR